MILYILLEYITSSFHFQICQFWSSLSLIWLVWIGSCQYCSSFQKALFSLIGFMCCSLVSISLISALSRSQLFLHLDQWSQRRRRQLEHFKPGLNGEIRTFQDKCKPREFVDTTLALRKILKGLHRGESTTDSVMRTQEK